MARNGSGTYSKVNTFVASNTITASGHNQNWDDLVSEMTNSVAVDGQSTMTGPLKASNGTAAAPSWTFGSDLDSGFYRITANSIGLALAGALAIEFATSTISIALPVNFAAAINIAAGAQNGLVGTPTYSFASDLDSGFYRIGANQVGIAAGGANIIDVGTATTSIAGAFVLSGAFNGASTVKGTGFIVGANPTATPGKLPTYQIFTSGTAQTYTTPAGVTWIRVKVAGGGGGGGSGGGTGGTGGTTSFNSVTAVGGSGGLSHSGVSQAAGGAGGTGGTGTATLRVAGQAGHAGSCGVAAGAGGTGGRGGSSAFFGGGGREDVAGIVNTGGGGGGVSGGSAQGGDGGGGGGEYYELLIAPTAAQQFTYTVGAAGTVGAGSGTGAAGRIVVEEYYN